MNGAVSLGLTALALGSTLGCTPYPTQKNLPPDCSVLNAYDFDLIDSEFNMLYGANDATSTTSVYTSVDSFPDGPLCNDTTGMHVIGTYYNDWGSLFGFYSFGRHDEAARTGMSFWARAPGNSGKGITILLDDPNTYNPSASCPVDAGATETIVPPGDGGAYCSTYCSPDAGSSPTATPPVFDTSTNTPLSSGTSTAPLPANACSNSYQWEMSLTADWSFYTIPFPEFQQQPNPDRVPNKELPVTGSTARTALLTSAIWNLTFRMPKGASYELWFDHMGFYSKKTTDGGSGGQ